MDLKIKCVDTATSSDGSQYGKFIIEPLERGFGTTIGNALRRVLLSSLEGTAVTSARIESITHEYTAIPGVLEDVIDVMLNLKGLVVKTDSKEAQHLRIDVDKAGAVLASDIQLPAGVKVVNPDWLICTVSEGGSFHADVIVETGKGYVAHDVPRDSKGVSIDVLPIDATFMPIKRVSYNVEKTRVGDSIDFDKLTLEIWSNGSIEVTTALSQASNLLIDHFMQIAAIKCRTPEVYAGKIAAGKVYSLYYTVAHIGHRTGRNAAHPFQFCIKCLRRFQAAFVAFRDWSVGFIFFYKIRFTGGEVHLFFLSPQSVL